MMSLSNKQQKFAYNVSQLISYIFENGYACTFGEALRTSRQAEWYDNRGIGIKNSLHCKRLAIDLNLFNDKNEYLTTCNEYERFGLFWESLHSNNRWGGSFKNKDCNHFEMIEDSDEEKRDNEKV